MKASVYVSDSHDPWFNLAFEDWSVRQTIQTSFPVLYGSLSSRPCRLFRKTDPEQKILYMYRNSPSVIIGRNQVRIVLHSRTKESHLDNLDVHLRRTPGKKSILRDYEKSTSPSFEERAEAAQFTMYVKAPAPNVRTPDRDGPLQDLGNTNYCVFVPRSEFDRKTNAELVTRGLNQLEIDAYVNDRNDICVDGFKMSLLRPRCS